MEKNDLKNIKNLNNNLSMSIIEMDIINTYIKHKASLKAFNNYVDSLGNDKAKHFNIQLGNARKGSTQ